MTRHIHRLPAISALCAGLCLASVQAQAADTEFTLQIKDHKFEPSELHVPANAHIKLTVTNNDAKAEEFDSKPLSREKLIPAGASIPIHIGPLKPGRYEFIGEFNPKSAKGTIIAE